MVANGLQPDIIPSQSTETTDDSEELSSKVYTKTIVLPIFPDSNKFFCCFQRLHITVSGCKLVSVIWSFAYVGLVAVVVLGGSSAAVLNAILIALSVSICTIYGTYRWCKLCLIPFITLQVSYQTFVTLLPTMLAFPFSRLMPSCWLGEQAK
ncbi:unnamed protein product [Anisakis simplex]|uniref:Vesicle transport protein n=1 Tax=Anisakis simplex TaxID=6269 RepID=A0A0M3J5C5_ANISI|nr:unnamed protein product [Anisakis simplex]